MVEQFSRTRVVTIAERPDLIDTAAFWIWDAFWKNSRSLEDVRAAVEGANAAVGPPQCMLLLVDGVPVATAGLVACDLSSRPDLTPWLAAVYVRPESRGRGHARELVRTVERAAAAAGYDHMWLFTLTAEGLYRKVGWRSVETFEFEGTQAILMHRALEPPTHPG